MAAHALRKGRAYKYAVVGLRIPKLIVALQSQLERNSQCLQQSSIELLPTFMIGCRSCASAFILPAFDYSEGQTLTLMTDSDPTREQMLR